MEVEKQGGTRRARNNPHARISDLYHQLSPVVHIAMYFIK
jgi:hypothetical protein